MSLTPEHVYREATTMTLGLISFGQGHRLDGPKVPPDVQLSTQIRSVSPEYRRTGRLVLVTASSTILLCANVKCFITYVGSCTLLIIYLLSKFDILAS